MFSKLRKKKRRPERFILGILAASLALLADRTCAAYPVDFVLTAPAERKPRDFQIQDLEVALLDAEEADEQAEAVAKPAKRGIVRQKAAVVAAGAAEAAEEVGQVLGDLIGNIFGGNDAPNAQAKLDRNQLKQFEAQYGRHFDQIIKTELHFIRVVCQPTRQQYEALAKDGKFIRTRTINKFAMIHHGRNQRVSGSNDDDTRKPIAEGLLSSAKRHLTQEQVSRYENELAARSAARKHATVLVTTAKIDRKLVLNASQRSQVENMLDNNWSDTWNSTQMMMYGGQYFPNIPDQKLLSILTPSQKKVWKTVNQQSQVFFGLNFGLNQGVEIEDEKWEDETTEEPPETLDSSNDKSATQPGPAIDPEKSVDLLETAKDEEASR